MVSYEVVLGNIGKKLLKFLQDCLHNSNEAVGKASQAPNPEMMIYEEYMKKLLYEMMINLQDTRK